MAISVKPEVWSPWVVEAYKNSNTLSTSGMVELDTNPLIKDGGNLVKMPLYRSLKNTLSSAITEIRDYDDTVTPQRLADELDVAAVVTRGMGIKHSNIERLQQDGDAMAAVASQIGAYMAEYATDASLRSVITGTFTTALNDTDTFIYNAGISSGDSAITDSVIAGAAQRWGGEKADQLNAIVVHSAVAEQLRKYGATEVDAAIFGVEAVKQGRILVLAGRQILVNDALCAATAGIYPSYLFGGKPLYLGLQTNITFDSDHKADTGGGTDELYAYMSYAPHIPGVAYNVTTYRPGESVLQAGGTWSKVTSDDTNIKLVRIDSVVV